MYGCLDHIAASNAVARSRREITSGAGRTPDGRPRRVATAHDVVGRPEAAASARLAGGRRRRSRCRFVPRARSPPDTTWRSRAAQRARPDDEWRRSIIPRAATRPRARAAAPDARLMRSCRSVFISAFAAGSDALTAPSATQLELRPVEALDDGRMTQQRMQVHDAQRPREVTQT